jgi:hypothetical protein
VVVPRNEAKMLILALIGATWIVFCLMAVSLCVMARRGDDAMTLALATVAEPTQEVSFVATFAEPEATPAPVAPRAATQRSAV